MNVSGSMFSASLHKFHTWLYCDLSGEENSGKWLAGFGCSSCSRGRRKELSVRNR